MLLDKHGVLGPDTWRHLGDDEPAADGEAVTISFKRWQAEGERWREHSGPLGLRLPNDIAPAAIAAALDRVALVVLNFPRFVDGRAYSQARLLRDRFGFRGELRAAGNVLRDQLLFMARCGFDSFEVDTERARAENWSTAFREFDLFYQPANDRAEPILWRRLRNWQTAAE
ncbi:MAG: DUF934 domain-containing protein [Alphaproteobacteria bacterium]|nr:DUF934 domain-containing protein [Alphaproteobacteria bacterium]